MSDIDPTTFIDKIRSSKSFLYTLKKNELEIIALHLGINIMDVHTVEELRTVIKGELYKEVEETEITEPEEKSKGQQKVVS